MSAQKSEKSIRKPKTRSVHIRTDNGSPQQSPSPANKSSPPSYPPPSVPTSLAPTDKGKGIVIEEGKKRDLGKGIVIDNGKKQHSLDSDFDTRSERSGTSRYYNSPYASNVENPLPPSDPPFGNKSSYCNPPYESSYCNPPYASNVENSQPSNPQQGKYTSSFLYYPSSYYTILNYHPDKAEILDTRG
ncbi:hypothetical protein LWI28_016873 [Acer negundo]|uniref:Uncharacterized protein n=1 Tax=Acer negundo TaxID=4023 RepID=A0AAD5J6G2_ACENE|nr:hypothetical protein LWI28_016873 [Acer negundo]